MGYDDINKKSEEDNGSNNPAYNEKAWENMELLLDKHLPLKKKRRWFIFLLFPLLLAGTTVIFILQKRNSGNNFIVEPKSIPVQASPSTDKLIDKSNSIAASTSKKAATPAMQTPVKAVTENSLSASRTQSQFIPQYITGKKGKQYHRSQKHTQPPYLLEKMPVKKTDDVYNDFVRNKLLTATELSSATINGLTNITATPFVTIDSLSTQKTIDTVGKNPEDTNQTEAALSENKKVKENHSSLNKLSLNFSFGPDISSVGIDKPGKLTMQYGIGISYALSKKFTIRTGFFAGYKIYTADSSDYNPPANFWNYYSNLQKIDANCFVYEIPLTLVYHFTASKKHNWFFSGGLSSYLMKKETYSYSYKNAWGQPQSYKKTYRNENKHLFSVINISGGYQYQLSNRFSIMAEPYIKIPASGIGFGNVKLNSSGILFTAGFKPFLNKK